ncbi:MAG: hypothetical protein RMI89_00230 [Gloeomargarita sp. SKYBB_i_bin120]|nr:hypothetical protein [Gloeomargarita sp. SKYG98]MCS7291388.1 hypothetical protein [Gloeomargarita sp. SKYB120]MDW8176948.1 hypothetical protein [Gloeomargarita sp. SKYBB_i_bin120]
MLLNELSPIVQEFLQQPTAFLGGFVSGLLGLDLQQDPLKSWLERQMSTSQPPASPPPPSGPQQISID